MAKKNPATSEPAIGTKIAHLDDVDWGTYIYFAKRTKGRAEIWIWRIPRAGLKKPSNKRIKYREKYTRKEIEERKKPNGKLQEKVFRIPAENYHEGHVYVVLGNGDVVDRGKKASRFGSPAKGEKNSNFAGTIPLSKAKRVERGRTTRSVESDEKKEHQRTKKPYDVPGEKEPQVYASWAANPERSDWEGVDTVNDERFESEWREIQFPKEKIAPFLKHVLGTKYRPKKDVIRHSWRNKADRTYVVLVAHENAGFSTIWYQTPQKWGIEAKNAKTFKVAMAAAEGLMNSVPLPGGVYGTKSKVKRS